MSQAVLTAESPARRVRPRQYGIPLYVIVAVGVLLAAAPFPAAVLVPLYGGLILAAVFFGFRWQAAALRAMRQARRTGP